VDRILIEDEWPLLRAPIEQAAEAGMHTPK
jgi:hypothetical protein